MQIIIAIFSVTNLRRTRLLRIPHQWLQLVLRFASE